MPAAPSVTVTLFHIERRHEARNGWERVAYRPVESEARRLLAKYRADALHPRFDTRWDWRLTKQTTITTDIPV